MLDLCKVRLFYCTAFRYEQIPCLKKGTTSAPETFVDLYHDVKLDHGESHVLVDRAVLEYEVQKLPYPHLSPPQLDLLRRPTVENG